MQVTAAVLRALGVRPDLAETWAGPITNACARHAIDTRLRIAAFLANVLHETGNLTATIESLNYTPERLIEVWPAHFGPSNAYRLGRTADHPADQEMIAEVAYGGRLGNGPGTGDGWLYRGRGLIQLTGKANYQAFAAKIGVPLADLPALLQMPAGAAESAAAYWQKASCNEEADTGDIEAVRRLVNGGSNGLPMVRVLYARALTVIGDSVPTTSQQTPNPDGAVGTTSLQDVPPPSPKPSPWAALIAALLSLFRRN